VPAAAPYATATFFTVVRTSLETPSNDLEAATIADYGAALQSAAAGTLHKEHALEWEKTIWASGFETDRGDLAAAVNSSLYAIMSSVRNDREYGLSPGGLTAGYNGHSFWDCETWMFPGVALTHPDTAQTLLDYRLARLSGAREKASSYSPPFSGAMFPWESAFTGEEVCPSWAATGLREVHINGDISMAVWQLWRALQDNGGGFLNATAWPLLSGIAEFWMSKLALDNPSANATSPLSLLNVIPPDEYADHVNNSAFTNHGAISTLLLADAVSQLLGQGPVAQWTSAAERIVRPYDAVRDFTPEYDGYKPSQVIKQADAILLGFPLEAPWVAPSTRANNLAIYGKVTDPGGPAMTWGMFSVGYIELGAGFEEAAASNFNKSFANAQPPFLVWTETPTGGTPNFLTGAGGFLQTAFQGYSGLRINDTALTLSPRLPQGASTIKLRGLAYLGNRIDVLYTADFIQFSLQVSHLGLSNTREKQQQQQQGGGRSGGGDRTAATALPPFHCDLCMPPAGEPIAWRSQYGRVLMNKGSHVVTPRALQLLDAKGNAHPLTPGAAPIQIPTQSCTIVGI